MNKITSLLAIIMLILFISSCSTELKDYEKIEQPFDIKVYFDGPVTAWGMIQNYENKVQRRFCVEVVGTWKGNTGILAEKFYFTDGEITYRNWQLTQQSDGSYIGKAEDAVGAAIGKHQGIAFQLKYNLLLSLDDNTYEVAMNDWMYQIDKYRVMNKTAMSKFGVKVAEITLFFDKESPVSACAKSS